MASWVKRDRWEVTQQQQDGYHLCPDSDLRF